MKKIYVKPDAEYILFYSDEEITRDIPLSEGMQHLGNDMGGGVMSGTLDDVENPFGKT